MATRWEGFAWGICMSSSKYHREQASILAGLALSAANAAARIASIWLRWNIWSGRRLRMAQPIAIRHARA